ncbi:FtsX-like permease family protein [Pseudosporangium ferrugineum]|uniref:ABC transporter permease n=1 Tax=Pseudosporangium ferrugineum TaxID=439699 RepID=UPI000D072D59|nr:FtsX-like permease family protein [Pseudosporangium ferrugineum]
MISAGIRRRKVQTLVVALATLMAVTASVLGAGLVAASDAPFDTAFARERGAHATVLYDAAQTDVQHLSSAAAAAAVASSAGPFAVASATPEIKGDAGYAPLTVVGRPGPDGPVDRLTLTEGTWATQPGQVVLNVDGEIFPELGLRLDFPQLPGKPTLTVVGVARSVTRSASAWVAPSQIAGLLPAGRPGGYQMLYRFRSAATAAEVDAGTAEVNAGLGPHAVAGVQSWLTAKEEADRNTALFIPFLVAFGLLGLIMSVLIVGNVVAGAVGTGIRRIGILKAVGFTPGQVVLVYIAQALVPAFAGIVMGVIAGNFLARPVMADAEQVYGSASLTIAPWIDLAVAAGAVLIVGLTAWATAWRAGRLRTVEAIAVGRTPRPGRGQRAARLTARLPLPRAVTLGLSRPFARPARALAMTTAVLFGAIAVTFALGLGSTLDHIMTARAHDVADVTVRPGEDSVADAATGIPSALSARPETKAFYGEGTTQMTIAGTPGFTNVIAFTGDASWGGYELLRPGLDGDIETWRNTGDACTEEVQR